MRAKFAVVGILAACAAGGASRADIIPVHKTGSPATLAPNLHRFTYSSSVAIDSRADNGDYFVIYDFAGFTGEQSAPTGWDFAALNVGPVPLGTLPSDDPNVPNLVWTWTGPSIIGEQVIGDFSANSTFSLIGFDSFAGQSTRSTGPDIGSAITNVGFISVPLAPEPGAVSVLAVGAIASLRRRRAR